MCAMGLGHNFFQHTRDSQNVRGQIEYLANYSTQFGKTHTHNTRMLWK